MNYPIMNYAIMNYHIKTNQDYGTGYNISLP